MKSASHTSQRTRSFARVLGPYLVIVFAVAVVHMPDMRRVLIEYTTSAVWPWLAGSLALLSGFAIVAFHNRWRDPAAVIVSLFGWILVTRGILLTAFPDTVARLADRLAGSIGVLQGICALMAVIGVYLTVVGWMPVRKPAQPTEAAPGRDLPRAA